MSLNEHLFSFDMYKEQSWWKEIWIGTMVGKGQLPLRSSIFSMNSPIMYYLYDQKKNMDA